MTTEPFRYRCQHGFTLDEECYYCMQVRLYSDSRCIRAESNLAHSPTWRMAQHRLQQLAPDAVS